MFPYVPLKSSGCLKLDARLLFTKYLIDAGIFTAKRGNKLPDQKKMLVSAIATRGGSPPVFHFSVVRDALGF